MKNRITIVAENSKPFDPKYKESMESALKSAWQVLLETLVIDPDDKIIVEKVEVYE